MSKESILHTHGVPSQPGSAHFTGRRLAKILAAALFCVWLVRATQSIKVTWTSAKGTAPKEASLDDDEAVWDDIPTLPYLQYTKCYDDLQCARLQLPMDWWNGTTKATISLAVIRRPAVVPITHAQYGGAVLLNPGGPGGSGVGLVLRSAKHVRDTIDAANGTEGKYFDLISFDPRGVVRTRPGIACIKNLGLDQAWQVRVMEEGVMEASDAAFGRLWSMSIARSQSCSLPLLEGWPDMRKYVTTASVARDMLEIVEKHGEWREKESRRILGLAARTPVPNSLVYQRGQEKILYWGFSYGTYLGNTFAAMFPDRVHRLVVDGVVNAYNYKASLWSDNLDDTEADWSQFFFHCARAGYPACVLANKTGETTADGVRARVERISNSLYHNPLPVVLPNPEVITYSDVKNLIFAGVYSPMQSFPYIANVLAGLERGDGTEFAKLLRPFHEPTCPGSRGSGFSIVPLRNHSALSMTYDATMSIACTDGDDQSWVNRTTFEAYTKELAAVSPSIGSMWSTIRMHCVHYSIRPYHRFEGPWIAKTSHPLLLIGNTADPVTPVKHALMMAKGFEGAVALTQDSAGHCSSSATSNCTTTYIRRYFQTGELPPVNTTCPIDEFPFGPGNNETHAASVQTLRTRERSAGMHAGLVAANGGFMRGALSGRLTDAWFN
ncbi:hypothetical protein BAUCODRAFT_61119 [Baudoinia panamericana UAMH 10762]|uniref:Peptidase S33 tripeptidyl aminopeptidase-like C-terminal domain-containing protein n=1 Tax=Baudoinia panamericana (strain UAMH 10762) TaxID=717646 RepID=M2NM76_BAUPA|nr:uncharacterized protein BAUCODRAFT_61119 [Baudoinia panamericana UAMH 10762]EMD00605.1 hypothetical protein BAUCODRAFT_61119 [Baudoinia panamericana UAMH 10762]